MHTQFYAHFKWNSRYKTTNIQNINEIKRTLRQFSIPWNNIKEQSLHRNVVIDDSLISNRAFQSARQFILSLHKYYNQY